MRIGTTIAKEGVCMWTNGLLGMAVAALALISMALLCSWETEESVKKVLAKEKNTSK